MKTTQSIVAKTSFVLNVLSFGFNFDNYVILPVLQLRITSPYYANSSNILYGWIAASFAIAALCGSMLFGGWADRRGSKEPLLWAQIIMIAGDVLTYVRLNSPWSILGGRIISGFGAGSRTCCLWYIAKTTNGGERGKKIGNWYAVGMLGMILGPGFSVLSGLAFSTNKDGGMFGITAYNAPAVFSMALHLLCLYLICKYVEDPPEIGTTSTPPVDAEEAQSLLSSGAANSESASAPWACFVLVICQYLLVTSINSFETFVVPLFTDRFHSESWVVALVFVGIGVVVLVSAVVSGILNNGFQWSERQIEITGIIMFIIGCVFSYEFNGMSNAILITFEVFSTFFVAFGFTMAFCMQPSLFSKLIMNHKGGVLLPKMGSYMAWLSMAASAAKISGPLITGYGLTANSDLGKSVNFLVTLVIGMAVLCGVVYLAGWSKLIVSEADEIANANELAEENKYLEPRSDIRRNDGSFDVRKSFAESSRTMSMGEAAMSKLISDS